MKLALPILLAFVIPASAQQMARGPYADQIRPLSAKESAQLKCTRDAPWVMPKGYYEECFRRAER